MDFKPLLIKYELQSTLESDICIHTWCIAVIPCQEIYWRIPASMSPNQLNDAAGLLHSRDVTDPVSEDEDSDKENDEGANESPVEEYEHTAQLSRREALAALLKSKGKSVPVSSTQSTAKSGSLVHTPCVIFFSKKMITFVFHIVVEAERQLKRPRLANREAFLESSSDEENEIVSQKERKVVERKKRVRMLELDSENEDEEEDFSNAVSSEIGTFENVRDEDDQPMPKKPRNSDSRSEMESDEEEPGLQIDLSANDEEINSPVCSTVDLHSCAAVAESLSTIEESHDSCGSMQDLVMSQTIS